MCKQTHLLGIGLALIVGGVIAAYLLREPEKPSRIVENPATSQPSVDEKAVPASASEMVVDVSVSCPGMSPEEIERQVAIPLELSCAGMEGLTSARTRSQFGMCRLHLTFDKSVKDIHQARQRVQSVLAQVQPQLPKAIGIPLIENRSPDQLPMLWLVMSSPQRDSLSISQFFDKEIREPLQFLTGIAGMDLNGHSEPLTRIHLDPDKLVAFGLSLSDVSKALRIDGLVRTGEAIAPKDLRDTVITQKNGTPIFLRDIAAIVATAKRSGSARWNGRPVLAAGVHLQPSADPGTTIAEVKDFLARIRKSLPQDFTVEVAADFTRGGKKPSEDLLVEIRFPDGTFFEQADRLVGEFESRLRQAIPDGELGLLTLSTETEPTVARMVAALNLNEKRLLAPTEFADKVRSLGEQFPGIHVRVLDLSKQPLPHVRVYPVRLVLQGKDLEDLSRWASGVVASTREDRVLRDVLAEFNGRNPSLRSTIDREKIAMLGITPAEVMEMIEAADGLHCKGFILQLGAEPVSSNRLECLMDLRIIGTKESQQVPLRNVVQFERVASVTCIERISGQRVVEITATLAPGSDLDLEYAILKRLAEEVRSKLSLPDTYRVLD